MSCGYKNTEMENRNEVRTDYHYVDKQFILSLVINTLWMEAMYKLYK